MHRSLTRGAVVATTMALTIFASSAPAIADPTPVAPATAFEQGLGRPVMDRLYDNRLDAESSTWLAIHLFNVPIDHARAADTSQFTIASAEDPAYAEGKSVHPTQTSSRTRAIRVPLRKKMLVKETVVFLALPTPMKNGATYRVKVAEIGGTLPELNPLTFDDRTHISDAIRLNQLGYLPGYAKVAYLGQYLGSAGPLEFEAKTFELLDRNGRAVFNGKVKPRGVGDKLVGQTVTELDFSKFETPGTYRVSVPGVGLSSPFTIGAHALDPLYTNLMRGHFHQRCGMAVTAEHSRHTHEACHLDDAYLEAVAPTLKNFVNPKNPPLYEADYNGQQLKAIHGHHDAGDYGKYTITGAQYVFSALNAFEVFPDKFREDNLGLPYSGNGVPDLLEEVKWELDWLENMQDPADGGVFGVIRPRNGGYEQFMPPAEAKRLHFPKDTVFTAAYAGALARAARSPQIREHYAADADRYLEKARRAWDWLQKNDRFTEYFHYGAVFGDWDERCWAAAELYAATGEEDYHRYFLEKFDPTKKRWDWWPMFESAGHAATTYAFLEDRKRDPKMLEGSRAAIREAAAMHVRHSEAYPYRLSMPEPSIRYGQYGWIFPGDLAGYDLLMGYALDKDRRFLEVALDNLHYICGANPSGHFLQTGLGAKRNIEVVDQESAFDNIIEPVPGIPLGIGSAGFYWLALYEKTVDEGTYPSAEWPLMNRWYDGFNVQTEFTMGPMMRETLVAAFFADLGKAATQPPTVKITADSLTGPAPHAVQFDIEAMALGGEIRQVFWDFGDETFSTSRSPRHVFAEPGREYPVAVTVVDEHGLSAYATTTVLSALDHASFAQQPHEPDSDTVALFHFDGDLTDAGPRGLAVEVHSTRTSERSAYRFNEAPPTWMASPNGSCLVLDGAEHFTVTLPADALPKPATTPFTLEMMLYLDEFAAWGYEGNPLLLGLRNRWDSMVGLQQETWEKANAPKFGDAIPSSRFAAEFPKQRWCHVKIAYDGQGSARFLVDGTEWGVLGGQPLKPEANEPVMLHLGPFRGKVDEVRLRVGAE